jgi:TM2 domain-containing membrane protein YozV
MYKIIGNDGKQYGPINAEMIRRWQAENRVNAQTLIQAEGAVEWKPISTLPEFSGGINSIPPTIAPPPPMASRASNKIPAGICGILLGGFGVHKFILGYSGAGGIMLAITLGSLFGGFLTCGLTFPIYGVMHIIGLVEGIIYLTKPDEEFVRTYVDGRKEWF